MLLVARQQEVELGLERGAGPVAVERLEEGVVHVFEDLHSLEALREHLDQGRLAYADRSVDGQVPVRERVHGHCPDYTIPGGAGRGP